MIYQDSLIKRKKSFNTGFIVIALLFCFPFYFPFNERSQGYTPRIVHTTEYDFDFHKNVFGSIFTEPFESLLIVFKDGKRSLSFTIHDEIRTGLDTFEIKYLLDKRGRKIEDIAYTVHNHLTPRRPTTGNFRAHNSLKEMGFEGPSFVYYPATGKLLPIK